MASDTISADLTISVMVCKLPVSGRRGNPPPRPARQLPQAGPAQSREPRLVYGELVATERVFHLVAFF